MPRGGAGCHGWGRRDRPALAGKFRDLRGKLQQRYPDVRGVLRDASTRVKLWRGTWRKGSGYDPSREGRVIAELRKLQQRAQEEHDSTKEKEVAAAETKSFDSAFDQDSDGGYQTSDSEAEKP